VKQRTLTPAQKRFLKNETFHGHEIVAGTRRLCLMNLFLHNIGEIDGDSLIASTDALVAAPRRPSTTCSPTRPSARRAR
jgi:type I restriction enzyme M protein